MFDADQPIKSSAEDKLNRFVFAKYLARCMIEHADPESLVIGLHGDWGVGKTSLINLAKEELAFAASNMLDEEQPIILDFNAWNYSGQPLFIYHFFILLLTKLNEEPHLQAAQHIDYLLDQYACLFKKMKSHPYHQAPNEKRTWWEKISFRKRKKIVLKTFDQDITQIKKEIDDLLINLNRKIIIIIDNISRLQDEEIRKVFQISKTLGNFPNTVYLLAFNKTQVIHALNRVNGFGGEEYIEKIIQLPFEIPPISGQAMENIFESRMNEVIEMVPIDSWNNEYWADIYLGSLKYFFNNCRDITRYINTLAFSYPHSRDIVNPVDFFAITAIEIFLPEVYKNIRENKDLFSDLLDNVYHFTEAEIIEDKTRCDEILEKNKRISREILLNLLMQLFPRLRHLYEPEQSFYHSDAKARMLHRICSPDLFDTYFRLSLPLPDISSAEFSTILSISNNVVEFDHALARLNQDERIIQFLDHLDSQTINAIQVQHIPAILNALIDNADLFPQGLHSPLTLDTPMRIHRIIHYLLQRFESPEDRFSLMQTAIASASKSLYIIVHEIQEQEREHTEDSDTFLPIEFRDLMPDQLESLQKLAVNCIKNWAHSGNLQDHPKILPILLAWREWGSKDDCFHYVKNLTASDRGLIAFLTATLEKAINQAMTQYEKNPLWGRYLEDINAFIDTSAIEEHAKNLFEDEYFEKLREKEQLALMIFLDLIKAKTKKEIRRTSP